MPDARCPISRPPLGETCSQANHVFTHICAEDARAAPQRLFAISALKLCPGGFSVTVPGCKVHQRCIEHLRAAATLHSTLKIFRKHITHGDTSRRRHTTTHVRCDRDWLRNQRRLGGEGTQRKRAENPRARTWA